MEWFASGRDLEKLAARLIAFEDSTARDIMSVSTSLPQAVQDEWGYIGYNGGSEPGVLNLTWLLQDEADRWHMLAMSWNDADNTLDNTKLELLAQRLLALANKPE